MKAEIKEKLIKARKEVGYTQKEMADNLGISESYYNHLENGNRRMPLKIALDIASILNKTPNDIFLTDNFPKRKVKGLTNQKTDTKIVESA